MAAAPLFGLASLISACMASPTTMTSSQPDPQAQTQGQGQTQTPADPIERAFAQAQQRPWREVLREDGTGDWTQQWSLDGLKARVVNTPEGMELHAGPVPDEDASHAVLWTQQSFEGDIKVEYDYTRLDRSDRGVNIIYLLATGSGEPPYVEDIARWAELRGVPTMSKYFRNMNTYHISYAAATYDADGEPTNNDYVRGRRYMPEFDSLRGTNLEPEYHGTGLFRQGVPHHVVVIKSGDRLFMRADNAEQCRLFAFDTTKLPEVTHGRVGLRQMFTRNARYANIRISSISE